MKPLALALALMSAAPPPPGEVTVAAHQRAVWLAAGGALLSVAGAALLAYGLTERSPHELVGGLALIGFGLNVELLSLISARWPLLLGAWP